MKTFIVTLPTGETNSIVADEDFVKSNYTQYEAVVEPQKPNIESAKLKSKLQFFHSFEKEERKEINKLAKSNEDIEDFLFLLQMQDTLNLDSPEIIDFLNELKAVNVLTQERINIILGAEDGTL